MLATFLAAVTGYVVFWAVVILFEPWRRYGGR